MKQKLEYAPIQLRQILRMMGVTIQDIADKMDVSYPTASKWLTDPLTMTGYTRRKVAGILRISYDRMDDICNGKPVPPVWIRSGNPVFMDPADMVG